jgi:quinol monooxygenase YgiN
MSGHVYVISEWLPKENCEQECWKQLKKLMATTLENEKGCLSARAMRQIAHPGSPGKSKYTIVLQQEYVDIKAYDLHCNAEYVKSFVKKYIEDKETALIADGTCRLFSENG